MFQPSDNLTGVAASLGSDTASIIDVNGDNIQPFQTIFVPVSRLPNISQPNVTASPATSVRRVERKGAIIGLSIGLGVCGILLVLLIGVWVYRHVMVEKIKEIEGDKERPLVGRGTGLKAEEVNLMADVSDCLDKYKVYGIEELRDATGGFSERSLIQGSVYKGSIDGELYAIKKMKWNAYEELKILQKVKNFSHTLLHICHSIVLFTLPSSTFSISRIRPLQNFQNLLSKKSLNLIIQKIVLCCHMPDEI